MSSCTSIYIKSKELELNSKNCICIFQLDTTSSRELNVLPYTESYSFGENSNDETKKSFIRPLTADIIDEIINFYNNNISQYKQSIIDYKISLSELNDRILKINSLEIYKIIDEEIKSIEESIRDVEEYITDEQELLDKFNYAIDILENNSSYINNDYISNYELFYSKS